jgi:hypothetical protein
MNFHELSARKRHCANRKNPLLVLVLKRRPELVSRPIVKSLKWILALGFLLVLSNVPSAQAWQGMPVPSLHVQGNQLNDPYGNTVLLHGWRISDNPYFCDNGAFFNSPNDYAGCLTYLKNVVNTFTHTNGLYGSTHGWYANEIRLGCDSYWFGDWVDGSFSLSRLQAYTTNILVPFSQYCQSNGLYLVIFPNVTIPQDTTTNIVQSTLLTIWNYWSSLPQLQNAGNLQFELCNEPINAYANGTWGNGSQPYYDALKNWLQPIVDTIRGHGAGNIIWVPGLGYQSQYAGYAVNPINGTNIGYAAHIYPTYGGVGNDPTSLQNFWNSNYKPCADLYPMNITETYWESNFPGDPTYWQLFNGITGNDSQGFGTALHHTLDNQGNVSFEIGITGDLIVNADPTDFGFLNSQPGRDDAAVPAFEWFYNYRFMGPASSPAVNAFSQIEAERYSSLFGSVQAEGCEEGGQDLGFLASGDYARYRNVDFTNGATDFIARLAGFGGTLTVRVDATNGPVLGTFNLPATGGWQSWVTRSFPITNPADVTGIHDVYLMFSAGYNLNWFDFTQAGVSPYVSAPDPGFETPAIGNNFSYAPTGSPWTFSTPASNVGSGILGNGSAFGNPPAPEGSQVGFVQSTGSLSLPVPGINLTQPWTVSFLAAQRSYQPGGASNTVNIYLDNVQIGSVTPSGTNYSLYSVSSSVVAPSSYTNLYQVAGATLIDNVGMSPGSHILKFQGSSPSDNTMFLDDLQISYPASTSATINVNNPSFEQGAQPDGGQTSNPTPIPGWNTYGGAFGTINPDNTDFANASGDTTPLPAPADGFQCAYANGGSGLYQDVGPLHPLTTYTLTVAVGARNSVSWGEGSGTIQLINGTNTAGNVLATVPISNNGLAGDFKNFSVSFTTPASVSGNLTIALNTTAATQICYDNVQLTTQVTPVTVSMQAGGANPILTWPMGTLLQATNVTGSYVPVTGAVSPWPITPSAAQMFYKVQLP